MSSGARANRTGIRQEDYIRDWLNDLGYNEVSQRNFFNLRCLQQPIYASQCTIGKNIYGRNRRVDFILYHPQRWRDCLVIQSKWQASSGSVDEKLAFEVLSIEINEHPVIILLDGDGYSKGARDWVKSQVKEHTKLIHVFNQGEFHRFASNGKL